MKKNLLILIFAFIGITTMHPLVAQTYDPYAVQVINNLVANNGLQATPDAPETWSDFTEWNDETPKQIISLYLACKSMTGAASFAGLTTLKYLSIFSNGLTKLDLTNCTQLKWLDCEMNQLTELGLTNCAQLETIACAGNKLTKLDLTSCTQLESLGCYVNYLTEINLTNCTELGELLCFDNHLTGLDLTGLDKLHYFDAGCQRPPQITLYENEVGEYTQTISLNNPTFNNSAISYSDGILKSTNNTVASTYFTVQTIGKDFQLDGTMNFNYKVGINPQEKVELNIYPNPTTGELRIENGEWRMENGEWRIENGELKMKSVEVYDIYGRKLQSKIVNLKSEIVIDISHLNSGIYLVKITTEQGEVIKKVVKH